jgi:hypothetical protein
MPKVKEWHETLKWSVGIFFQMLFESDLRRLRAVAPELSEAEARRQTHLDVATMVAAGLSQIQVEQVVPTEEETPSRDGPEAVLAHLRSALRLATELDALWLIKAGICPPSAKNIAIMNVRPAADGVCQELARADAAEPGAASGVVQ